MMAAVQIVAGALVIAITAYLRKIRKEAMNESFFDPVLMAPVDPPAPAFTLTETDEIVVAADGTMHCYPSGSVIVTAHGVRLPLRWFSDDADLDRSLALLEELDQLETAL